MALLPKNRTKRKTSLSEQTVMLYGMPKAGKSGMCAQIPDALFLATEPGLNHLDVFQVPVNDWATFLTAAGELDKGDHPFKTIVVDTVDNAYKFCTAHVCKQLGVKHPADMPYGKGYALVNNEFHRVMTKLAGLPCGLFLISHAVEREIESRTGKYHKTMPTLPDGARKILLGMTDIILFADLEADTAKDGSITYRRVLRTKPDRHFEAGDRTGKLPDPLPLDFDAFRSAFGEAVSGCARSAPATPVTPKKTDNPQPTKEA